MAQLAEWLHPLPEINGSNPVIGEILIDHCLLSTVLIIEKDEDKEKDAENGPSFFKKKCTQSMEIKDFCLHRFYAFLYTRMLHGEAFAVELGFVLS